MTIPDRLDNGQWSPKGMIVQAQRTIPGTSILVEESTILVDPLNFIIQDFPKSPIDNGDQRWQVSNRPIRKAAEALREIPLTVLTGGCLVIVC